MYPRLLATCLCLLLSACASETRQPAAPAAPASPPAVSLPATAIEQPLPMHLRELRGRLLTPPAGSEVEIALLVVDERDRPQRLLGSLKLHADGQALPFRLTFDPSEFPHGVRVELRARISQSGRLILRLPPRLVTQADSRDLGNLSLVNAP